MGGPATRLTAPPVGNDVVDLDDPRCRGKGADERFLGRVLAPAEREAVRASADPDLALWRRWAAKEAAFKAVTRIRGEPPAFVHADFLVERASVSEGTVRWRDLSLPWRLSGGWAQGGLHVVAWWDDGPARPLLEGGTARVAGSEDIPLELLEERLTDRERRAVHSRPSALVRLHAREHLARLLDRGEDGLEIVCAEGPTGRVPPEVLVDDRAGGWSVSLSHHGDLLGWVLARWPRPGEREEGGVAAPAVPAGPRPRQNPGAR